MPIIDIMNCDDPLINGYMINTDTHTIQANANGLLASVMDYLETDYPYNSEGERRPEIVKELLEEAIVALDHTKATLVTAKRQLERIKETLKNSPHKAHHPEARMLIEQAIEIMNEH